MSYEGSSGFTDALVHREGKSPPILLGTNPREH